MVAKRLLMEENFLVMVGREATKEAVAAHLALMEVTGSTLPAVAVEQAHS